MKLNLQLFAENLMTTGSEGLSAEMKTFYEKRLIDLAEPKLVHGRFQGDSYPIPQGSGKQIEFPEVFYPGQGADSLDRGRDSQRQ